MVIRMVVFARKIQKNRIKMFFEVTLRIKECLLEWLIFHQDLVWLSRVVNNVVAKYLGSL